MSVDATCTVCQGGVVKSKEALAKSKRFKKMVALYITMVAVSTIAIYFLEHASIMNAFRTALVAAIAKTVAASWVTSFFD